MKKSIFAFMASLFLIISFSVPSHADIMSWEDRAIFRSQLESTPIGETDPWGEIESSDYPDNGNELPDQERCTEIVESESTSEMQPVSILDECINVIKSLSESIK